MTIMLLVSFILSVRNKYYSKLRSNAIIPRFYENRKPTHPGEVLLQVVIEPLGITITEAAKRLGVSQQTLAALLNTNTSLSPEMAVRIGKATRTSPESWIQMQVKYDLWTVNQKTFEVEEWTASSEER